MVLMGESEKCIDEINLAVKNKVPIIVVDGSEFCQKVIEWIRDPDMCKENIMQESVRKGQFYILHKKSSEEIASFIHFLMVIQPKEKPNLPPKPKEETEETSPKKVGKQ